MLNCTQSPANLETAVMHSVSFLSVTTVFLDEAELWTSSQKSDTTANEWIVSFSNDSQFNGITSMTKKTMKHIFCIHKIN